MPNRGLYLAKVGLLGCLIEAYDTPPNRRDWHGNPPMENGTVIPRIRTSRQILPETHPLRRILHIRSNSKTDSDQHNIHSRCIRTMREGGTMFQRKFFCWFVILGLFTSVLAATLTGCGGSSPAASVAVTLAASTVDGNDTTTLTATVTNDKNSAGVTPRRRLRRRRRPVRRNPRRLRRPR
jgi:hypothetical protein